MIGATRTLSSQPSRSLGAKTASGGSRQRKPVAALRSASQALGAHRKNRPNGRGCSSEYRIFGDTLQAELPSIIGNTIGNLVGDGISSRGDSAKQANATPTPSSAADAGLTAEASASAAAVSIDTTQINLPPSDFTRLPAIFTADALAPLDTQAAANKATTVDQAVAQTGEGGASSSAAAAGGDTPQPNDIIVTGHRIVTPAVELAPDYSVPPTVGNATAAYLPNGDVVITAKHRTNWFAQQDAAQAAQHSGFYNFFHRDIPNALNAIGHFIEQQVRSNDNPWVNSTAQPSLSIRQLLAQPLTNPNSNLVQDYMESDGYGGAIIHTAPQGVSLTASAIAQWNQTETNSIQGAQFRDTFERVYVASNLVAVGAVAPQLGGALASQIGGRTALAQGISFSVGVTSTAGFNYVTKGNSATTGDYVAGAVFGGLGVTGFQFINTGSRLANYVGNGAVYGGLTETGGQIVDNGTDLQSYDLTKVGYATGAGGLIGAAGDQLEWRIQGINAGRNSNLSVYGGLNTRLQNGNISTFAPIYAERGGYAQGIIGIPAAGVNAAAIAVYPQQPNGK